ncbi:cell division protein FtsQ/DivIB [Parachryseolinea silvisoli]|jgi:cell division protein FtsQ|uniref:cell division protein FtsQ/DivIB n=1 Tax=Parachryseolinea silvisoli TaxID=2873601 RepID=UPI002265CF14|nr:cell division protein FtsQ/DivIB [Parachryseolinea silvisoli]MCD9018497.1 cell division protein FtsQ/DivIB [Parachryseolinea silvisoli]
MKVKFNLKREVKIIAAVIVVAIFIAFTERRQGDITVRDITVKIENEQENHFLDEADVMKLMQLNLENLRGTGLNEVNLKAIEQRVKSEPFVKEGELYSDLKGNMVIRVELRRPIARIVRNDGPDGYIAEDGTIMPVSEKFTSRVVLISGGFVRQLLKQKNVNDTEEGKQLIELINAIREDEFWNAQIAQLDMDSKARITMYSQVGDERIEFGRPDNPEVKFKKLRVFYKEILPRMGWNKYDRVNLEYEGQIVAE